jgi:hypothetical protein
MTDPMKWSDPRNVSAAPERAILEAAPDPTPPVGAEGRVWSGLLVGVGSTTMAGALGAGAAVKTASKTVTAIVVKAFLVGAASGSLVAVGGMWARERLREPVADPAAVSAQPAQRAIAVGAAPAPTVLAEPPLAPPARPSVRSPGREIEPPLTPQSEPPAVAPAASQAPEAPQPSALEREARLTREARERLQQSDLAGAFGALETARTLFPQGPLAQEREALGIELLVQSGQVEAADSRARAFLLAFPDSPHAARVRRALR